jgi:lipoprotein-releasing system permease protein
MGADKNYIQKIFISEGFVIATIGGGAGIIIAALICFVQIKFKIVKLAGGSFIIDYYPVQMVVTDFVLVAATVFIIALLGAWIPARKASMQLFTLKS